MKNHVYYFDELNVGGSTEALLHSYVTETPIIIDTPRCPFMLEDCPRGADFSFLGLGKRAPLKKLQVWDRLSFLLSMGGYTVFPNNIKNIRYEEKKIVIITENNSKIVAHYSKLNEIDLLKTNYSWAYDWFDVKSGAIHKHNYISDEDDSFVKELFFYPSNRINVNHGAKDVVAISFVNNEELHSIEKSETYARFKTLLMMKNAGIKGRKNGYSTGGSQVHYSVQIEHAYREIKPHIIPQFSILELLEIPRQEQGKLWRLTKNLFKQKDYLI